MRRLVVNMLALATVLAGSGVGLGQQAETPPKRKVIRVEEEEDAKAKTPPTKSKLEEMLAEALKNNPDIRVAVAKLAEADAELNRTRLQVTQKIATLYHTIDAQKAVVEHQEAKFKQTQTQVARVPGSVPRDELEGAKLTLTQAKAKLAELEAQMPALLGKVEGLGKAIDPSNLMRITIGSDDGKPQDHRKVRGPLADKVRKALETPVKVDYKDVTFAEVLKDLEKKAPGLSIRDFPRSNDIKVTLRFEEALPVSAILQALADDWSMSFVVREYGILVTMPEGAPPGALTVQEFLRQKPADAPRK